MQKLHVDASESCQCFGTEDLFRRKSEIDTKGLTLLCLRVAIGYLLNTYTNAHSKIHFSWS